MMLPRTFVPKGGFHYKAVHSPLLVDDNAHPSLAVRQQPLILKSM
jgi:hypothetical protein